MAEETVATASEAAPAAEVVVTEAAPEDKATVAEPPAAEEKLAEEAPPAAEEKPTGAEEPAAAVETVVPESDSFKEESNVVADLEDPENKALEEFKQLILAALANNEFTPPPPPPPPPAVPEEPPKVEEPPAKTEEEAKTEDPVAPAPAEEPAAAPAVEDVEPPKVEEPTASTKVAEIEPPKSEIAVEIAPPAKEEEVAEEKPEEKTVEAIEETVVPVAAPPPPAEEVTPAETPAAATAAPPEDVFIWGVPLVGDEKTDTVLLKFLRARDFKVKDALTMIKNAVIWRKQFGIDGLLDEDLGVPPELEKVVFMHGLDKEGHPVCYNVYGEFQDKDLYSKAFGDAEKREKFLKWRIQFLEKGIRQHLDFTPGGTCTMVQVTDLKSVAGPGRRELRQGTKQALALLQDNYPEFVAKQVFINVPWWYLAYNQMISSVFTPRSKSKFVFAGQSRSAETLFKYIAPEQVPVQYGGLSKENDPDFTTADAVTEVTIKPSSKHTIEIPLTETGLLVWELRVLGWEVSYGAEFVPSAEDGYTVIVTKARKFVATDEPVVKNTFKVGEPGKVVLTIDNTTSKKKKLLYRTKVKSATESV